MQTARCQAEEIPVGTFFDLSAPPVAQFPGNLGGITVVKKKTILPVVEDEIVGVISTMVALLSCRGRKKMKISGKAFFIRVVNRTGNPPGF